MNISVVCSDNSHPVYLPLKNWCERQAGSHVVELVTRVSELSGGDLLFLISCSEIVPKRVRDRYRTSLVIHASDLPSGRGWSPLIWQILEGRSKIAVTLLEAGDAVDSGSVWQKSWLEFAGTELYDELNEALFTAELDLMDFAVANIDQVQPTPQQADGKTWYPRRRPEDSKLDPRRSLAEHFDLLRVSDPRRYPAYFEYRGEVYEIFIKRRAKL
jgi:methionyl-tRNA formyltransferase